MLTDEDIDRLLRVSKQITNPRARKISQRGSERVNYDALGENGERFQVYIRQNLRVPDGFSCGLLHIAENGSTTTLTRYNGSDHEHANPLDGGKPMPPACHIHIATEKYINAGRKAEHYAQTTDRYNDLPGAIRALAADCNINGLAIDSSESQMELL